MEALAICGCSSHNGFLTAKGLAETAQLEFLRAQGLTRSDKGVRLDMVGSVSGLRRDEEPHVWDDEVLEEQYQRFLPVFPEKDPTPSDPKIGRREGPDGS